MRTLLTGCTGLVGSALIGGLHSYGHDIRCLKRNKDNGNFWLTDELHSGDEQTGEFDNIIHLAGENVADKRWNAAKKERILNSRVEGTRHIVDYISTLDNPPKNLLCASAGGYYGSRGKELLTENSGLGAGFLANVCKQWETEARRAESFGTRVVYLRFGMVLSPHGGALKKMIPPFKAGLGGILGRGDQYMSWISIRDIPAMINFIIDNEELKGPVNMVSPGAVTNKEFTATLAEVVAKPAKIPAPVFALKLMFGEMAEEMLLSSCRAHPKKLLDAGYVFQDTDLKSTLEYCVKGS